MGPSRPFVVSLEVDHEDHTVFNLRAQGQWIHTQVDPNDLKRAALRNEYLELLQCHRDEEAQRNTTVTPATRQTSRSHDSGYGSGREHDDHDENLQSWLLRVFRSTYQNLSMKGRSQSLADWYDCPTQCFSLAASSNDATPSVQNRNDLDGMDYARKHLTPQINLPKYLRTLSVPWYDPSDLRVECEADDMHLSIHPTTVSLPTSKVCRTLVDANAVSTKSDRTSFFLKLATPSDETSVKRELRFLEQLRKQGLYDKGIRAPRLAGLVSLPRSYCSSQSNPPTKLLGFLLSLVPSPCTPLTSYIDPSADQSQRHKYSAEVRRMVDILHEHDLVWGDAKADNFLVDRNGTLWMIDFGGSFTPGWIDEELADTVEGDEMGTEKIANGLEDPDQNADAHAGTNAENQRKHRGVARDSGDRSIHREARKRKRDDSGKQGYGSKTSRLD